MQTTQPLRSRATAATTRRSVWKAVWEYRAIYLMLLPAIVAYVLFCYFPLYGVLMAFKEFSFSKGILHSPWVGWKHFEALFGMDKFWEVFGNTLIINLQRLFWGFPAPILLALLLNEIRWTKFKKAIQTIIYLPHFISWVTISGIVMALLSVNDGIVNQLIVACGGQPVEFLTNSQFFRPLVVVTGIWKEAGWGTIIYFAAICGIPAELYEAATIDGAGRLRQAISITLPCLAPTISILLILNVGGLMSGGFEQIFNLYNPMVYDVGDVIDTYIYRIGLTEGKFSLATAVGLFLNSINFVLLISVDRIAKRLGGSGIY